MEKQFLHSTNIKLHWFKYHPMHLLLFQLQPVGANEPMAQECELWSR